MAARKKNEDEQKNGNGAGALGFDAKLWETADKRQSHMDAADYKHVVLGLVFLNYISDAFEERRQCTLIRDALLSKRISGELRVRDADRLVAEAL